VLGITPTLPQAMSALSAPKDPTVHPQLDTVHVDQATTVVRVQSNTTLFPALPGTTALPTTCVLMVSI
jgi:hypothetical protein